MIEVRSAIHLRTGQRAVVQAVDDWLAQHSVDVVGFGDVYETCVHLLKNYDRIPELALVGADWLAAGELSIVSYVRQTWPRTGIVVYGTGAELPRLDLVPLSLACGSQVALRKLLTGTPEEVCRRLSAKMASDAIALEQRGPRSPLVPLGSPVLTRRRPQVNGPVNGRTADDETESPADEPGLKLSDSAPPRAILTSEELSALLDSADERTTG